MKRLTKQPLKRRPFHTPTIQGCVLGVSLVMGLAAILHFNVGVVTEARSQTRQLGKRELGRDDSEPSRQTVELIDGSSSADEILESAKLDQQLIRSLTAEQKVHLIMALDPADPLGNRLVLLSERLAREYDGTLLLPLGGADPVVSNWESPRLIFGRSSLRSPRRELLRRLLPYYADGMYGTPFSFYGEWFAPAPQETAVEPLDTSFEETVETQMAHWTLFEQKEFLKILYKKAAVENASRHVAPDSPRYRKFPRQFPDFRSRATRRSGALKTRRFNRIFRALRSIF